MDCKMQPPERPTISPSLRLMNKLATSPSANPLKVRGGMHASKKSTSPVLRPQHILTPHPTMSNVSSFHQGRPNTERVNAPSSLAASPSFEHMSGAVQSNSNQVYDSESSFRHSPLPGSSKFDKDLPQIPPSQKDNEEESNSTPLLIGLGVNGTTGAVQDESVAGPSNDSTYSWNNRRAAMKAAGQQASAGLMKFGKASAARIKQAQQRPHPLQLKRNRELGGISPTGNLMGALGISNGLRGYDGRGSKSTADLPNCSSFDEEVPGMPVFRTTDPNIGLPTDVKHNVHVDVGPNGYTGLPASWAQVLSQYGIDEKDVKRDPAEAARIVQERTEYYISREAEHGNDVESARKLLKSRLDDFADLKDAVINNPPGREREQSANDVTPKAAIRKVVKPLQATTSYTTSLNNLWPTLSPSSSIKGYISNQDTSPVLPEVAADEDDWVSTLLNSIPASTSNSSILSRRRRSAMNRRSRSIDGLNFDLVNGRGHPPELEIEEQLQDPQEEFHIESDHDYSEDDEIAAAASITTATMQVNGFAKPYLTSSASNSFLGSRDQSFSKRKSDGKSTSTQSHDQYSLSNDAAVSPCNSSTGDTSYFATTMQTSSSPLPALSASASPSPSSADRPSTASDNGYIGLGLGLRDRRKASPRIYPPAISKYIPKEDNLSPFSAYGFKRGSAGGYSDASATPQSIIARSRHHQVMPSQSSLDRDSNSSHSHNKYSKNSSRDQIEHLSNQGSSIDGTSLRSLDTDKDRQKKSEGPPLPPKAARVPNGQSAVDFILPDESGFYTVDKKRQDQPIKTMTAAPLSS